MALTVSPYATGFPSDSLDSIQNSPLRINTMSRAVSINMEGLSTGDNPNEQQPEQYVEGLDMDMVNFGEHMDMSFGTGNKGPTMVGEYRVCHTLRAPC